MAERWATPQPALTAQVSVARPFPPPAHGTPGLLEVAPQLWWRVHPHDPSTGRFAPEAFNDSGLGNGRLSPIVAEQDGKRRVVPTLDAASTPAGALMETVLRAVPFPSEGHIFDLTGALQAPLRLSEIVQPEPVRLADLTTLGLQRMRLWPSDLFESEMDDYPRTRQWATWIYQAAPDAQGMLWMSTRHNQATSAVFFGDRIAPGMLRPGGVALVPLSHPSVRETLIVLLDRLGCGISPDIS